MREKISLCEDARELMAQDAADLTQITSEARDIAEKVSKEPSTAHLLLAMFTLPNAAEELLRERGCDEDKLLAEMAALGAAPPEPRDLFAQALDRARQLADDCASPQASALHLLVALTRLSKSSAAMLLEKTAAPLASLRTAGLSVLTGPSLRRRPVPQDKAGEPRGAAVPTARVAGRQEREPLRPEPRPRDARPAEPPPPEARPAEAPLRDTRPVDRESPSELHAHASVPDSRPRETRPPERVVTLPPEPGVELRPTPPPPVQLSPQALDPQKYPWLASHARNLTQLAASGRLDPAVGRERETEQLLDILGKRRANNPVLVGEPGVGKTAIVEGLAQRLLSVSDRTLVELDVAGLVAGTQLRGSFSERLLGIKEEVKRADGKIVVFIDELHMLIGAGAAGEGPQDAANELKAALARGEFPCVGATTHEEYRKYIQGDAALERRFVPVLVREPSVAETSAILRGAKSHYEAHHQVVFTNDALDAAASLTARYVRDRFLPDKAFAAIDLAGSRVRREGRAQVAQGGAQVAQGRASGAWETRASVTRDDVARAVARMAGLPEERLLQPDGERFLQLETRLAARIVGHQQSLSLISRAIRRNYAGFSAQRPLASFLFCGPSGVGKTETARALADELFDGALVRIDLSEYAEAHTAARLVGAPPGYVGYGEGGQLTEAVRRKPASVVLLDEVEKAHLSVLQLLLQVLDEGQLTDGRGRRIDFSAAVVILTSNLGAQAFDGGGARAMGFAASPLTMPPGPSEHPQARRALEMARAAFPPELWGRLDERLVFAPLAREEVARIA
ncbi:MAG TPA: AAA family ATPase, partial [Myxococcales bacterium]